MANVTTEVPAATIRKARFQPKTTHDPLTVPGSCLLNLGTEGSSATRTYIESRDRANRRFTLDFLIEC
jgi:hypothetical protein